MSEFIPRSLLVLSLVGLGSTARAEGYCGNVDTDGACVDSKTLVWCDDGELRTTICAEGEVCTTHDNFGGASGCIGTEYTSCGDISEAGQCAGRERVVVWCDADHMRARRCDEGTVCHWVEEEGWYDCVPIALTNSTQTSPPDDNDTDEGGGTAPVEQRPDSLDTELPGRDLDSPMPTVEQGGADPAGDFVSGGGASGCAGSGPGGGPLSALLAALALLRLRLRRRPRASARL